MHKIEKRFCTLIFCKNRKKKIKKIKSKNKIKKRKLKKQNQKIKLKKEINNWGQLEEFWWEFNL